MAVSTADVRAIVDRIYARPDVLDACARRDLGAVISALGSAGITQGQISALTGVPQGRLSEWRTGKREPKSVSTFQKFADGVGLPAAARRALGLDPAAVTPINAITAADTTLSYLTERPRRQRTSPRCGARTSPTRARSYTAGSIPEHGVTPRFGGSSIPAACQSRNVPAAP
jgi:transcriptional regulator with XRE-family HTH domain